MSDGKSISVWYTEDERRRIEQAAVLAGYKHVSTYIRDKSLGKGSYRETVRDSIEGWAEKQELVARLTEIERSQKSAQALLTMLLFLIHKKATTKEVNELILAGEKAGVLTDMLSASMPELTKLLTRFTEDA